MLIRNSGKKDLFSQLNENFNRMLTPFDLRSEWTWPEVSITEWAPSIDVKEEDKRFVIHADVPGVKAKDIDVSMENGLLTIRGKRESEVKEEKSNYLRVERSSGSFLRQLSLPDAVDQNKIEAKCTDGVLEITLPKSAQSLGHKIVVKEGG